MGESTQEERRSAKRKDPNTPGGGSHGRFSAESATQRAQTRRRLAHLHGKLERLDVQVWSLAQLFSFIFFIVSKFTDLDGGKSNDIVRVCIREAQYTCSLLSSRVTQAYFFNIFEKTEVSTKLKEISAQNSTKW